MTIRQLMQSAPAKANELFAKLVDTSDGAVKTRERLFAELKTEMETLARLEEEHLFPVLRKHKETKGLVTEAINDNKRARDLLAELDRTPKEGADFAQKVEELRKVFQQHVRDERKELLPAVAKALSDEEAQSVVENIEQGKVAIEEEKAAEAERRRAAARREREAEEAREAAERKAEEGRKAAERQRVEAERQQAEAARRGVETVRRSVEATADTVRTSVASAREVTETAEETVRSGYEAGSRVVQDGVGAMGGVLNTVVRDAQRRSLHAAWGLSAIAQANTEMSRHYQQIWREWLEFSQRAAREGLEGAGRVAAARTPQELLEAQVGLLKREVQLFLESNARVSEIAAGAALSAHRRIQDADKDRRSA